MSQRIVEVSREYDRSKGFLFGLYVGLLSLLILVAVFDPFHLPEGVPNVAKNYTFKIEHLHTATNIYGILALAGAVLGFWRVWKWADKPRRLLSRPSVWICIGLVFWTVAEAVWIDRPRYPDWGDIPFILADVCWLVALFTVFKLLNRPLKPEINQFTALIALSLGLLLSAFAWLDRRLLEPPLDPDKLGELLTDLIYIFLTFCSVGLAVLLVSGENARRPLPVHRCLRYLFAATGINALATLAYIVTQPSKLPGGSWLYSDGNWVDWLFLTAMYCWGISALKCPIRETELQYTYSTTLKMKVGDFYRALEITKHYLHPEPDSERRIYVKEANWIFANIRGCWNIVKLGDLVVGSTFLFPVSRALINRFRADEITEREMFEEVMKNPLTWECLYLADASILESHRRRRLAFNCFKETIDWVADEHNDLKIEVHCLPNTLDRTGLAEELREHFKGTRVQVCLPKDTVKDVIGGKL